MPDLRILYLALILLAISNPYISDYLTTTEHCYYQITTLSPSHPSANCFTVSRSGLFKRVYTSKRQSGSSTGYVLPGLWDGHGHLLQYGEFLSSVDLFHTDSLGDVRGRLASFAERFPDAGGRDSWIRGSGWDQAAFGGVMPTSADLESDDKLYGKYIMLDRVDVHCVWVSRAVLDLLPDPLPDLVDGGEIIREPGLGVFCDNAMDIVRSVIPTVPRERKAEWIRSAMGSLNSMGIVGVHDAGVAPEDLELYEDRVTSEDWTVRVYAMFACTEKNNFCPNAARKIATSDNLLTVRSVKLFADGALGSWGSAMIEPYNDRPNDVGSLLVNASTLTSLAKSWAAAGYQVNIHAIGDLANRNTIDALTTALETICPGKNADLKACQESARFRIEHAQIIHPIDQSRIHDLGIIPSIQPTHATSDMEYAEDRLGKQRTEEEAYRMQSFFDLQPILGSDFPVEPANPFEGVFAAVTRRSPRTGRGRGGTKDGWHVEEGLTVMEALRGFTQYPARGAFLEGRAGVIQESAFADWIVLDVDLMKIPIDDVRSVQVRETWIGGKRVYKRN